MSVVALITECFMNKWRKWERVPRSLVQLIRGLREDGIYLSIQMTRRRRWTRSRRKRRRNLIHYLYE